LEVLPEMPLALEIGLSADRQMARALRELEKVVLFSNSDAHSLPKIAREYNLLSVADNSFQGLYQLVRGIKGEVISNYGLPPVYGKYHRTYCLVCEKVVEGPPPIMECPTCGSVQVVMGVLDRLASIADGEIPTSQDPHYVYQLPLQELPGIGPKMYKRLLQHFGTEMQVLHEVPVEELISFAGEKVGNWISFSRQGKLEFQAGGGGLFGKLVDILPRVLE